MRRNLARIRFAARFLARTPRLRTLPVADMTDYVAAAVLAQLDFALERRNLVALRGQLATSGVVIPAVGRGWSADVLAMEYLPAFGDPSPPKAGTSTPAARALVEAVFHMLFTTGLVHCDLHPGNVAVGPDGVVHIIDAGFVVPTDTSLRRRFCEFFLGLSLGNGPRCARSVLAVAVAVPKDLDYAEFTANISDIVARYTGLPAAQFSIAAFVSELTR